MPLIYISPSTQNYNVYAYAATNEAVQMQKIAEKTVELLRSYGCQAVLPGLYTDVEKRISEANAMGADCYVALHSSGGGGSGAEGFYNPEKEGSNQLCEYIYKAVAHIGPSEGRGVHNGMAAYGGLGYTELRLVKQAPCIIKVEFHDRTDLARWICEHTAEIAVAVTAGILRYFNMCNQQICGQADSETHFYRLYMQYGVYPTAESAAQAEEILKDMGFPCYTFFD
ncbi:MAG: N-acetylmuramoyl-L-alanine amidase [Oscillospiraceae bacterium]|nr:N-acetylmuramoyl-L-alanine amidase [Oscillospiraceae bacterium]